MRNVGGGGKKLVPFHKIHKWLETITTLVLTGLLGMLRNNKKYNSYSAKLFKTAKLVQTLNKLFTYLFPAQLNAVTLGFLTNI